MKKNKVVAIIPARGGSKGIKDKNIVPVAGQPLIYHVLETCKNTKEIDMTVVTTNSDLIKSVVLKKYPNTVIIDRPDDLSNDSATSEEALLHAIDSIQNNYSSIDKILFVQATSPLTSSLDLSSLLDSLNSFDSSVFYVEDYCTFFDFKADIDLMKKPRQPRQKRKPRRREVGNAWAFRADDFMKYKVRLFGNIGLCKIQPPRDYEIDEVSDLMVIEAIMSQK